MKFFLTVVIFTTLLAGCGTHSGITQGDRLRQEQNYIAALKEYQKAQSELTPQSSAYVQVSEKIADVKVSIVDAVLHTAKQTFGVQPNVPKLEKALSILRSNLQYDDAKERVKKEIDREKRLATNLKFKQKQLLSRFDNKIEEKEWNLAYQSLSSAKRLDPSNVSLKRKEKYFVTTRNTFYKYAVEDAVADENWQEIKSLLTIFESMQPLMDPEVQNTAKVKFQELIDRKMKKDVNKLVREKKYYSAKQLLFTAGVEESTLIQKINRDGGRHYLKQAQNSGNTLSFRYLAAVKAMLLDSLNGQIFRVHRDLEDKLNKDIQVHIAVSGFNSPVNDPGIGTHFSDQLIAYLVHHLPYGIKILERSKIDLMLLESGRELRELSKVLGSKMFIIGNVSILDIEHQRSESQASVAVKAGQKTEPNPLYNQMLVTYGSNTSNWPSIPPPTVETDLTELVTYTLGKERVKGHMNVSVRIFDAEKGAITVAETFKVNEEAKDVFQDAVVAANIQYDDLDLPSDNEIKEKMLENSVVKVANVVLQAFEQREWRFWSRAEARMQRKEKKRAIRELAKGHLYCKMSGISADNTYCTKISDAGLLQLTE